MLVLTWAGGYRQAIRQARQFRNWRALGVLTKFQVRYRPKIGSPFWGPWEYVKTELK